MSEVAQPPKSREGLIVPIIIAGAGLLNLATFGGVVLDQKFLSPPPDVYFSPQGGCEQAVVNAIDGANEQVLVQAYAFTSVAIRDALIRARNRLPKGEVIVLVDKEHGGQAGKQYDQIPHLVANGVDVYLDNSVLWSAHDKVIIIDRRKVITGSFNFTYAAENGNGENLLILSHAEVVQKYLANWRKHSTNAVPLVMSPP